MAFDLVDISRWRSLSAFLCASVNVVLPVKITKRCEGFLLASLLCSCCGRVVGLMVVCLVDLLVDWVTGQVLGWFVGLLMDA